MFIKLDGQILLAVQWNKTIYHEVCKHIVRKNILLRVKGKQSLYLSAKQLLK